MEDTSGFPVTWGHDKSSSGDGVELPLNPLLAAPSAKQVFPEDRSETAYCVGTSHTFEFCVGEKTLGPGGHSKGI